MTALLSPSTERTFGQLVEERAALNAGLWAEIRLGLVNEEIHWEMYEAEIAHPRLAISAPREFAKSETLTVNSTAHRCRWPGYWQYVFSDTQDQAKDLLRRIVSALAMAEPWLLEPMYKDEETEKVFSNYSRINVASRGTKTRGKHPDRIVGDDILNDLVTATHYQREKVRRWWMGDVVNMAHGPIRRRLGWGYARGEIEWVILPSTTMVLTGTPFHEGDLLQSMKTNRLWHYRRYQAYARKEELVPGTVAVEVA